MSSSSTEPQGTDTRSKTQDGRLHYWRGLHLPGATLLCVSIRLCSAVMLIATVRAIALGRGLVLLGRYLSVPGVDHDTGLGNAAVRGISGRFKRQESACKPLWLPHLRLVDFISRHD